MFNSNKQNSHIKNKGRIYTPDFIVKNILDLADYKENILEKNIIDNSCGDGAFLIEIVKRYCNVFFKRYSAQQKDKLKIHLEKYIHGIEIENEEIIQCINKLDLLVKQYGVSNVKWDIICDNTLLVNKYNNKMDFVVGNPPYVRVHNLAESYKKVKEFEFSKNGMTDLYIVFFEIGFKMLNSSGKMCLITPSSCLRSNAGENFRKYIFKNKNLTKIVDLEHFQPFNATTYTMITLFEISKKTDHVEYYIYDEVKKEPIKIDKLDYLDMFIDGRIYISKKENLSLLHQIEIYNKNILKKIVVKNGFATLADSIFIGNFEFKELTIDILKASTGKWYKCIFPYNNIGRPLDISQIKKYKDVYSYLLKNKEALNHRSLDIKNQWFLFGRTQAIKDVFKEKIAINTIIRDIKSLRLELVPAGNGVYSGLYILSDYSLKEIRDIIKDDDFIKYIKLLKNYKSGGYYTFSSGELQKFLTFKLRKNNYEQSSIFTTSN